MPTADLAPWLATLGEESLELVVRLRPDVLLGSPVRDLDDLAARLQHPASVAGAVRTLSLPQLQALEVLVALGAGASVASVGALLAGAPSAGAVREPGGHDDLVAEVLADLVDHALAWPADDDGHLRANPGLLAVLDRPLGLGEPAAVVVPEVPVQELQQVVRRWGLDVPRRKAETVDAVLAFLGDAPAVRRVVGHAPPEVADVLVARARAAATRWPQRYLGAAGDLDEPDEDDDADVVGLGWSAPLPSYLGPRFDPQEYRRQRAAAQWCSDNGLSYGSRYDPLFAEVPAEVLLALLDPAARAPFAPFAPHVPTAPVAPEQVRTAGAAALTETLATVMACLEHLSRHPATALKAGGIGARELTRLAKVLGAEPPDVRFALELALRLGLLGAVAPGRLGVSEEFAAWRSQPPAQRATGLVGAWVNLDLAPTLDRADDGTSLPALARFAGDDAPVATRVAVFQLLRGLPDGVAVTAPAAVAPLVQWRLPLVVGQVGVDLVPRTFDEAARLGLVALGALTPAGAALWSETSDELADALAGVLPQVQTSARVGSDLTVVVLGSPAPEVVDLLDAVAAREARGQASTWRLTPASVRGALDAGHTADDVLAGLRALAGGELPQPVDYLVRDVARRHGHLRAGAAAAVVVGDDPALVAEVAAHRSLRRLGLRAVAPTVLVSSSAVPQVLAGLREAGYLPVEVGQDGEPVVQVRRLALAMGTHVAPDDEAAGGPDDEAAGGPDDEAAGGPDDDEPATFALARPVAPPVAPAEESAAEAVARLVRGEPAPRQDETDLLAAELAVDARRLTRGELHQLAHAILHHLPVQIRYRSRSGGVTVRVVSGLSVEHGYLVGWCHLRDGSRLFALDGLLAVVAEPS